MNARMWHGAVPDYHSISGNRGAFCEVIHSNLVARAFDTARACIEGCDNRCSLHRFEPGDDLPEQMNTVTLFDQAEMSLDAGSDETHRDTAFSGASRSSYTVCVVHGRARQIVIHYRRQLRNIDATRGDIGGYENPGPLALKSSSEGLHIVQRGRSRRRSRAHKGGIARKWLARSTSWIM
jgi:hypothetical protein